MYNIHTVLVKIKASNVGKQIFYIVWENCKDCKIILRIKSKNK